MFKKDSGIFTNALSIPDLAPIEEKPKEQPHCQDLQAS